MKKRYWLLIFTIIFLIIWWNYPLIALAIAYPLAIIIVLYLSSLWISIMFWGVTGKDPFWITFLKKNNKK